jgi:Domain of unknown function (DUF4123)
MSPSRSVSVDVVQAELFSNGGSVFAVLDGAAIPNLLPVLYRIRPPFECLYRGELNPDMAEVAPYLVQLEPASEFTQWVLTQGWGKSWGIFVSTKADLTTLRRHFRAFLTVHDENGRPLLFRFYDPRVLRFYLPTCNAGELAIFFGRVDSYLVESETAAGLIQFEYQAQALKQAEKDVQSNEANARA